MKSPGAVTHGVRPIAHKGIARTIGLPLAATIIASYMLTAGIQSSNASIPTIRKSSTATQVDEE